MEAPQPTNEYERLVELAELDLDYTNLQDNLDDLTKLAARIVGAEVSLINLIDGYTQWSVANYGIDLKQMPREDSVCQYTILKEASLEIKDLKKDERFNNKFYVAKGPELRYYYGVPLKTSSGSNIGALCVLDSQVNEISPEDKELLNMIGNQVVRRLEALKKIKELEGRVEKLNKTNRMVGHDIRSPISGIIGIADMMEQEIENDRVKEVLDLVKMIKKGGQSLLQLADTIMEQEDSEDEQPGRNQFSCDSFCEKLSELYLPQAKAKNINLDIATLDDSDDIFFSKSRLLQIVGNLITNSIKFTEEGGNVYVKIKVIGANDDQAFDILSIKVEDTGVGMSEDKVKEVLRGEGDSDGGTKGEKGYGFGLKLVHHLIQKANGELELSSQKSKGTKFLIKLPVR